MLCPLEGGLVGGEWGAAGLTVQECEDVSALDDGVQRSFTGSRPAAQDI